MGPFFKFVLAESWGCPGMLRMPSGFKAWRLFAHGLQTRLIGQNVCPDRTSVSIH